MNVLVINAGSSSLKYQLINVETHEVRARGICEKVGYEDSFHKHGFGENEVVNHVHMANHTEAIHQVLVCLTSGPNKAVDSLDAIDAVGHRIVQGGSYFDHSVRINDDVIEKISELTELAPLHNGAALMGIEACMSQMPGKPEVAVFDSAFFQTLPPTAYIYPIPYEYYEKYQIRRYGAHGTSHRYVAIQAAKFLGKPLEELQLITCHLGNGCSMSAIDHGVAVDTSMGLTPLDGLMMGTRCGAIDPAIVTFIEDHEDLSPQAMNDLMNKKSGLLGISGISNDMRSIDEAAQAGNERAHLACDMYAYSAKKYIGQYLAVMGGADAIILTAGVGENSASIREKIFSGLDTLGIELDLELNQARGGEREISTPHSQVRILVIPTNEEYMIAHDTYDVLKANI